MLGGGAAQARGGAHVHMGGGTPDHDSPFQVRPKRRVDNTELKKDTICLQNITNVYFLFI